MTHSEQHFIVKDNPNMERAILNMEHAMMREIGKSIAGLHGIRKVGLPNMFSDLPPFEARYELIVQVFDMEQWESFKKSIRGMFVPLDPKRIYFDDMVHTLEGQMNSKERKNDSKFHFPDLKNHR